MYIYDVSFSSWLRLVSKVWMKILLRSRFEGLLFFVFLGKVLHQLFGARSDLRLHHLQLLRAEGGRQCRAHVLPVLVPDVDERATEDAVFFVERLQLRKDLRSRGFNSLRTDMYTIVIVSSLSSS